MAVLLPENTTELCAETPGSMVGPFVSFTTWSRRTFCRRNKMIIDNLTITGIIIAIAITISLIVITKTRNIKRKQCNG